MEKVDRTNEGSHEDATITVTLDCGFSIDFFEMSLTDEEYISRAKIIKKLELQLTNPLPNGEEIK